MTREEVMQRVWERIQDTFDAAPPVVDYAVQEFTEHAVAAWSSMPPELGRAIVYVVSRAFGH